MIMIASIPVLAALLSASLSRASALVVVRMHALEGRDLLPLGANCTTDAECGSDKCWPQHWYYGQTICSPSPVGHSCSANSDCVTSICTDNVCQQGDYSGTHLCYTTADCSTQVCRSAYLGGGMNTQCFYAETGFPCNAANATQCVSHNCGNIDTTTGYGTCLPSQQYGSCYSGADCATGLQCDVLSMSDPLGDCWPIINS